MKRFAEYLPSPQEPKPRFTGAIRPMALADVTEVQALIARRDGHADRARLSSSVGSTSEIACVAELEGRVVGYARASLTHATPAAPDGWYLSGLVVDDSARRCGIGRLMTIARTTALRDRGIERCYFVSNEANLASIELHTQLGFELVGSITSFPGITFTNGTGLLFQTLLRDVAKIG